LKIPFLMSVKPMWKKGQWVAECNSMTPRFGTVVELFEADGEWLLNLDVWLENGTNPHRVSPPEGGPTRFEPALSAQRFKRITAPELPFKTPSGRAWNLGESFVHLLTFVND